MEEKVVGMAEVDQIPVVSRQRFEPVIGGFNENLRLISLLSQHPLDAEHLMADRIAVAKCCQHLVDLDHREAPLPLRDGPGRVAASPASSSEGPFGRAE